MLGFRAVSSVIFQQTYFFYNKLSLVDFLTKRGNTFITGRTKGKELLEAIRIELKCEARSTGKLTHPNKSDRFRRDQKYICNLSTDRRRMEYEF